MSKFALDKQFEELTTKFEYRGLVFILKAAPDLSAWNKLRTEQITKAGEDPDLMKKKPDDGGASIEQVTRWHGRAMMGPIVVSIEPFELGDGTKFVYSDPSDMEYYDTCGEELLGESPILQDDVFKEALRLRKEPLDYEVKALGKSSPPSGSGET